MGAGFFIFRLHSAYIFFNQFCKQVFNICKLLILWCLGRESNSYGDMPQGILSPNSLAFIYFDCAFVSMIMLDI